MPVKVVEAESRDGWLGRGRVARSRASAREVVWRCEQGHEWTAAVYQGTLSGSGCPECYRAEAAARSRAGKTRARRAREEAEAAKVIPIRAWAQGGHAS